MGHSMGHGIRNSMSHSISHSIDHGMGYQSALSMILLNETDHEPVTALAHKLQHVLACSSNLN